MFFIITIIIFYNGSSSRNNFIKHVKELFKKDEEYRVQTEKVTKHRKGGVTKNSGWK